MRVSYNWLKSHLESLPPPEKAAELLTFGAYEVESVEEAGNDHVFEIAVLPNRAHDSLSHVGVARELARLLGEPLSREQTKDYTARLKKEAVIELKEPSLCPRYMAAVIENVKVGPSPAWLRERLEAIGQRSVNNIVDITNFVMFETGQPLHAFDLGKLAGGEPHIIVRNAAAGEKIVTLDDKEYALKEGMLVIADEREAIAIAGVKGGKSASVTERTTDIVLEAANFAGVSVRKTSQALSLRTESSLRFEHGLAPALAEEGMRLAVELVLKLASTEKTSAGNMSDAYPRKRQPYKFGASVSEVNKVLGTGLSEKEVEGILKRLGFAYEKISPLERVLELAPKFESVPYKYGASISYDAPGAFDCSSFTAFLFAQAGIGLPRITVDQFVYGTPIKKGELRPGDLVFAKNAPVEEKQEFTRVADGKKVSQQVNHYVTKEFLPGTAVPKGVDHNGIYLGGGKIIHASGKWHKNSVVIEKMAASPAFKEIIGFRRIISNDEPRFVVTAPYERLDLMAARSFLVSGIKEDLIEELGRVYGYRNIKAAKPKPAAKKPAPNKEFHYANVARALLVNEGFSEVMTYAFKAHGEVEVANPLADDKRFLRASLEDGLLESMELAIKDRPLLGLSEVKIFEIGKVFTKGKEYTELGIGIHGPGKNGAARAAETLERVRSVLSKKLGVTVEGKATPTGLLLVDFDALVTKLPAPKKAPPAVRPQRTVRYKKISPYPFVLRDIAVFVPKGTGSDEVLGAIEREGGPLLVQKKLFDMFEKDGRVSYAFNLVFQSDEKTLSAAEVNGIMDKMTVVLNKKWQVR